MTTPARINFKIYQGSTFSEVLRWESSQKTYVPITAIAQSAPLVVTAPGHNLTPDWRVKFTNISGMTELNGDTYYQVTSVTSDTITINSVNSIGYKAYIAGGIVEYNTPIDLTGVTGRMQIRASANSDTVIQELTSTNGLLNISNVNKTITLTMSDTITAGFDFSTAVYGLELISSSGQVTPFCVGSIALFKEVTR